MQVRRIQINTNSNKPVTQISSRMAWIPVSKAESGSKCVHCDQLIHQIVQKHSQTKQAFIEIMWMVLNSAYLALHVEKKSYILPGFAIFAFLKTPCNRKVFSSILFTNKSTFKIFADSLSPSARLVAMVEKPLV